MSKSSGRVWCLSFALVALILGATPALGGIGNAFFRADRDNSLYEEGTSNGAGEHLFSGNTSNQDARRALLHFDLTTVTLPEDATVTAMGINMWCTLSPATNSAPQTFSLHRVTADWGAAGSDAGNPGGLGAPPQTGDATWTDRFFGQGMPWATPGGDFVPTASGTTSVATCNAGSPTQVIFFSTPELVADIQGWLDDPASNFGWIMIGDEGTFGTARRFSSSDHNQLVQWPVLDIVYDFDNEVPATSTAGAILLVLLMTTAAVFALRRRTS